MGSSIGHAIGGFFGGGSSGAPAEPAQDNTTPATTGSQDNAYSSNAWGAGNCDADAKQFTQCLSEHQGNMQICGWYLEQLVCIPLHLGDASSRSFSVVCDDG